MVAVYVLSLGGERLEAMRRSLAAQGLGFRHVPGVRASGPRAGTRGCALGHLRALQTAQEAEQQLALVLEDDVRLEEAERL